MYVEERLQEFEKKQIDEKTSITFYRLRGMAIDHIGGDRAWSILSRVVKEAMIAREIVIWASSQDESVLDWRLRYILNSLTQKLWGEDL